MKFYRYLFFNLFQLWLKKKGEPENAHINAVMTITFTLYVNLMNVPLILMALFRRPIIDLPAISSEIKILIIAFLVGTGIINYLYLGKKDRFKLIIQEFSSIEQTRRKKDLIYTVIYLIITFSIPIYIFWFTKPIGS